MFDPSTDLGRLLQAALRLAEQMPWRDVSLDAAGREAGLDLAAVRAVAKSKSHLLASFVRMVDDQVMRRVSGQRPGGESHRDRLFDVIMTRFEVMLPYRQALKSIVADLRTSPGAIPVRSMMNSHYWMLAAAGISGEGLRGTARVSGLATLYAQVLDVWLDDDEPGQAKTMAALDKRLRRAEKMFGSVEDAVATAKRIVGSLVPGRSKSSRPDWTADAPAGSGGGPVDNGNSAPTSPY